MLVDFYLVCLAFIVLFLFVSLFTKSKELLWRVITLTLLLHILVFAIWSKHIGFLAFVFIVYIISADEVRRPYKMNQIAFGLLAVVVFTVLYGIPWLLFPGLPLCIAVSAGVFLLPARLVRQKWFALTFVYAVLGVGAVSLLQIRFNGTAPIIALILLLQLNDAAGYIVGKWVGKTKIFPSISPNKSLEGYAGGAFGTVLGLVLLSTVIPVLQHTDTWKTVVLGLFIIAAGNLGDLLLSALKRKLGIKDFSSLLPGHGGILDRFDNILFTAPLFLWLWFWLFPTHVLLAH